MRIDVSAPDAWGRLSERYRAELPLALQDPSLNVHIFSGVQHAVIETAQALAHVFAHKKTIAILSQVDPAFETIAVQFSQNEFQVRMITPEQAKDAETWSALMDELLFVLAAEDDPITGRLIDLSSLETATKGKRVFKLLVSHEAHAFKQTERPEPFVAKILSLTSGRALLIGGERHRMQPLLAPALHWSEESDTEVGTNLAGLTSPAAKAEVDSLREKVLKFESNLPSGFKAYFKADESRLYDRTVFYHENYDGLSVIDELSSTLQTPIRPIGENSQLETTSACRWESPRFQDWLIARGETEERIRGLVIASSKLIDNGLATHLETAAHKLDRLQKG